ncbi:unnamed protein product, partial [Brassica rapa subsp. trilocularis]
PKTTITIDKNKSSLVKEIQLHAFNQKRLIAEWIERPKAKNYNDKSEINPEASRSKPPERKVNRQNQKPHGIFEKTEETVGVESRPHRA